MELAEAVFRMPVRLGVPQHVCGLTEVIQNPIYSTGVGLLLHGYYQQLDGKNNTYMINDGVKNVWQRMKGWFQGNF